MTKKNLKGLITSDLFSEAEKVLGNSASVERWFYSHPKAFAGKTPYEVYRTNPQEVYTLLGRIQHGVFS